MIYRAHDHYASTKWMCLVILYIYILILVHHPSVVIAALDFTFNLSPNNITVNKIAVYKCSLNDGNVPLQWFANVTQLPDDDYANFSVNENNTPSSRSSTLTILGLPQYNNTRVRCVASGFLSNGNNYYNFSETTLRIQGLLAGVQELFCQKSDKYCIQCNWSEPFSLTDIPGYIVNITTTTNGGELVITDTTVNTSWSYCPSHFGYYTISVAGNNTAGQGEVRADSVNLPTVNINVTTYKRRVDSNGDWWFTFSIMDTTPLDTTSSHYDVFARLTQYNVNMVIEEQGMGTFDRTQFIGSINFGPLTEKMKWNLSIGLQYPTRGLFINTSVPIEFSTFGIHKDSLSVSNPNPETGKVCVTVEFVDGSSTTECLVTFLCQNAQYSETILVSRKNISNTSCDSGVFTNYYTVTFYDGPMDSSENKVFSFNQTVQGLIDDSTSSSIIMPPSPTPSMSQLPEEERSEPSNGVNTKAIIAGVCVVFGCILVIVAFAVGVIMYKTKLTISRKRKNKCADPVKLQAVAEKSEINVHTHTEVTMVAGNKKVTTYTQVDTGETSLAAPLPQDTNVQYNEVFVQNPTVGVYSVVTTTTNISVSDSQDNSDYNRLHHNSHPHQPAIGVESNGEGEVMYNVLQRDTKPVHTHTVPTEGYSTLPAFACNSNYSSITKPDTVITNKTELTHTDLKALTVPHLTHKWYEVGMALAITPDDLEDIRENHQGISDVFILWQDEATRPFTWETLIMVLKSPKVNETQLAEQLKTALYQ